MHHQDIIEQQDTVIETSDHTEPKDVASGDVCNCLRVLRAATNNRALCQELSRTQIKGWSNEEDISVLDVL